ncbi:zinc metallopeptidase [Fictibacillus barbaricus]|uniref:Zinc metallopeptidase n=1 Tax=Fictibacillus barbaricus TaxID=182136 RepID=A0ABS2Z937_9BACL|nr:zinc metallopeptidase [Fictibacillus barbaricus]MBN3543921.1 zinc metallopeptidase [Fictibacillus barbaricus]GGB71749.1 hypothetical protein GCM10007199_42440 [Fictibacillus barbaricus]
MVIKSKDIATAILDGNNFSYKEIKYIDLGVSRCSYDPDNPHDTVIYLNNNHYKDDDYEAAVVGAHEAAHALNNFFNNSHVKELKKIYRAYIKATIISVVLAAIYFLALFLMSTKLNGTWIAVIFIPFFLLKMLWYIYATKKYNKPYEDIYNKDEQNAEKTAERELKKHVINNSIDFPLLTKEEKDKLIEAMENRITYSYKNKIKTRDHIGIAVFEFLALIVILGAKFVISLYV